MTNQKIKSRHRQEGAVTLIVTVMVLAAVVIGSLGMVQSSTLETRMTANERNAREALQAAQAGIDRVLAGLAMIPTDGTADEINDAIDFLCEMSHMDDAPFFELNFEGPQAIGGDPANGWTLTFPSTEEACRSNPFGLLTQLRVWSRGYAVNDQDEIQSVRTITSLIDMNLVYVTDYDLDTSDSDPGGGGGGRAPLVTIGNADFQGTPEVALCITLGQCSELARPGNQTGVIDGTLVNAGGQVSAQGNVPMGEENYVANNEDLQRLSTTDAGLSEEQIQQRRDEFFETYVMDNMTYTQFAESSNTLTFTQTSGGGQGGGGGSSSTINQIGSSNQVLVDGNFTFRNGTIGSADAPVVLVVDGNLTLTGNAIIWGIVYVTGTAEFSTGTNKIMGSLVSEGNVQMKGNAAVYYNNDLRPRLVTVDDDEASDPGTAGSNVGVRRAAMRIGSWREVVN